MDKKRAEELSAEKEKIERDATGRSPRWFERLATLPDGEKEKHMQALLPQRTFERWKLLTRVLADEVPL